MIFILLVYLFLAKVERQNKETKWMLKLQTVYPYGLNDRVGDKYMTQRESRVVDNMFYVLTITSSIQMPRL